MHILYATGWFLARSFATIAGRIQIFGREHIPRIGGFILATNHISYFDPPVVGSCINRPLYFFAKAELFKNPFFAGILHRVNALPVKRGVVDRKALSLAINTIKNGHGLTMFPEGTRSKNGQLLPPKPGLGLIASRAQCPIVPGYVHGTNTVKKCLTFRDRMFVVFGEPVTAEWVGSIAKEKEGYMEISRAVMSRIAELGQQYQK